MDNKNNSAENNITDDISKEEITFVKVEYPLKYQDLLFEQSDSVFELGGYVNYYFD